MNSGNFDFYDKTSLKSYNLNETMRYQLNMLDRLDAFTRKHCENVANLTCRLCEHLHCQKGFIEYCTICAYLHDIGKLFIPSEILQKPGKLTDEEYEIMKTHTTLGHKMCMDDLKLRPYAAGPLYHHEALNGSGYPNGLVKKDIPYEGQIIRVADEYDALVNKRQYKSHIGITDTLKIIIANTAPSPNAPKHTGYTKAGKNNKKVVRALLKVVVDDIEYEISASVDYVNSLKSEIKRLGQVEKCINKMNSAKSENKKNYYEQYAKLLLEKGESIEKFDSIYQEIKDSYQMKKQNLNDLYKEIKEVKKLYV